ncbi:hypothetical protein BC831DRAFT_466405 [Entophlyctis helioformis]|nr:hypothetical protein BC831DRAFT_466385 [Entophlyctis helioformis]KAI8924247.1 hypothetical protein BC831DRAFT_466405 [Entophlyctis helioformis]
MDRQRTMQTKFLMHVTGGTPYNGASMRKAHSRMRLTDEHFNVVLSTLAAALRECGVADVHIAQIAAVAETTRDDVLGRTPATDE